MNIKVIKIISRKIKVININMIIINNIYIFEIKLENLLKEIIIIYIFSLNNIDSILELS